MTDKELKKLSRLELLELLLEVSNENTMLKQKMEKMTNEIENSKSIENLAATTKQARDILDYAQKLVENMKTTSENMDVENVTSNKVVKNVPQHSKSYIDRNLYLRIMNFYSKNEKALEILPPELRSDIMNRVKEIINKRNNSLSGLIRSINVDG